MASVSKRTYYVNAAGREVPRGTRGAVKRVSRYWRIRVVLPGGRILSRRGYTDKQASVQLAMSLEKLAARGDQELTNPFQQQLARPLTEHIADLLADKAQQGRDDVYCRNLGYRLKILARECRWRRLPDVTRETFLAWRSERKGSGKTRNDFLDAARLLINWAIRGRRMPQGNPLALLEHLPAEPTFVRRALLAEELAGLYQVAPVYRQRVYAFAATTGLRRQEIKDLEWGDVVLDAPAPFLKLRAEATKARRSDAFALKPETAAMLKVMRGELGTLDVERSTFERVFSRVPEVETLLRDLKKAGVVLPADGATDRIDFHCLRTTLGSFIGLSGMPERVGMELMRVTDPALLRRTYCDPRVLATAAHITSLAIPTPPLPAVPVAPEAPPESQQARATGTHDAPLVVDVLPVLVLERGSNRTAETFREGPQLSSLGREGWTVGTPQVGLGWVVGPQLSAAGREGPPAENVPGMGVEPSGSRGGLPGNFKFPAAAGRMSDKGVLGGGQGGAVLTQRHEELRRLEAVWCRLTPAVRHAIVAMAEGAAKE